MRAGFRPTARLDVLRARARVLSTIRAFFARREVLEVETPLLASACVVEEHLDPIPVAYSDGSGRPQPRLLVTSPEAGMKRLLAIRCRQPAFHPNATQYTLHLGEELFSFWRQSRRREQSIFCVHNITNQQQAFPLGGLNLVETNDWFDLFTGREYVNFREEVVLEPYECLWLTNHRVA